MKKGASKRAIALVSLILILMVLLLLAGITTYVSEDIITESKEMAFAKDTSIIYDAVQEYYAVNGDIPTLDGGAQMDAATYESNITNEDFAAVLSEEIANNGDEDAIFYEIDMAKIGVEDTTYGTKQTEKDIYLISNVSHTIYYYPGRKINKDIYFSDSYILGK